MIATQAEHGVAGSDSLPPGWTWVQLGDLLLDIGAGYSFRCLGRPPTADEVGVVKISAVTWGEYDEGESKTCLEPGRVDPSLFIQPGDFLFSRANTLDLVGACVIAKTVTRRVMLSDKVLRFRLGEMAEPKWALHCLRSQYGRSEIERLATGNQMSMRNIGQDRLRSIRLPLPPLPEQRRIVAALDAAFARLDAAKVQLERVPGILKRYRAAVLAAAVEDRFTEDWRAEHAAELEPASVLVERILAERRVRWEAEEQEKFKKSGRTPPLDWRSKYAEPAAPDTSELLELPDGWCWTTLSALAELKGGVTKGQKRAPGERLRPVPYLRVANVQRGYLELSEIKTIEATEAEISELALLPGDILFTKGGDRDKLGRGWIWCGEIFECIHQNHIFRARLYGTGVQPKLISHYSNSKGQAFFLGEGKQTVNLASINLTKLSCLPVPVAPTAEQQEIVRRVERLLGLADAIEARLARATERVEQMRQALLAKAFRGELVPQGPNDEPASAMLARLRDAHAGSGLGRVPRRNARGRS